MQCQGVTLVPIYTEQMEKVVTRDTYTHNGAEEECETHNLTLAKEVQPTHTITECINRFRNKVLNTPNVNNQFTWLGDCKQNKCEYQYSQGNRTAYINTDQATKKEHKKASTIALCQKGKTHLVPDILQYLRTDLTLHC